MTMKQQTLTKSETLVMNILWEMGRGASVADVLERYAEPRPAYTTVLKSLEQKGFVEHRMGQGKQLVYSPLLTRERYQRQVMSDVKDTLFGGSGVKLVSFFAHNEELSEEELNEIKEIINSLER